VRVFSKDYPNPGRRLPANDEIIFFNIDGERVKTVVKSNSFWGCCEKCVFNDGPCYIGEYGFRCFGESNDIEGVKNIYFKELKMKTPNARDTYSIEIMGLQFKSELVPGMRDVFECCLAMVSNVIIDDSAEHFIKFRWEEDQKANYIAESKEWPLVLSSFLTYLIELEERGLLFERISKDFDISPWRIK
jgi:hypothetical protein